MALGCVLALAACAAGPAMSETGPLDTLRVPGDFATIQAAVEEAASGDLVLIGPGVYPEEVFVETPGITLRGTNRNSVVVDGEGTRGYGIVVTADGVRVENLTVRRTMFYGILITGMHGDDPNTHGLDGFNRLDPEEYSPVERFSVQHVTASNNGLYGIYAFDARHGVIADSYASGSADSGIYVGQCRRCDIFVTGNVAERNAVGFENANASDSVVVTRNRFSHNRVGMTLLSNHREAFTPQRGNTVLGNVITANDASESPARADGGFGIGVRISGGKNNVLRDNLVAGNPRAGVLLDSTKDLATTGNTIEGLWFANSVGPNGIDVANISTDRAAARSNCVHSAAQTLPRDLAAGCRTAAPQPAVGPDRLPTLEAPPGTGFLDVPAPPPQPGMDDVEAVPGPLPVNVTAGIALPDDAPAADLLTERSGVDE